MPSRSPKPTEENLSRRNVAAALLAVFGAPALAACTTNAGPSSETESLAIAPEALSGMAIKWVDSVLGAPPTAPRIGDLALTTGEQLGANVAIAKGCVTAGDGGGGVFYWDPAPAAAEGVDDGGTIIRPPNQRGVWRRVHSGPVSVKWFGAIGDGSQNDQPAIQKTIEAMPSSGGVVLFPAGTYKTTAPLRVTKSFVVLQGSGLSSKIVPTGAFDTVVFETDGPHLKGNGLSDLFFLESGKAGGRLVYARRIEQFTFHHVSGEHGYNGIELLDFNIVHMTDVHLVYYRGEANTAYLRAAGPAGTRSDVLWIKDCIFSNDPPCDGTPTAPTTCGEKGTPPIDTPPRAMKGIDIDGFVHTVNMTRVGIGNATSQALHVHNDVGGADVPSFITAYDLELEYPRFECIRLDAAVKASFTGSMLHGSKKSDNVFIGSACNGIDFVGGCSSGAALSGIAIDGKDVTVSGMRFNYNNGSDGGYPGILIGGRSRGVTVTGCRSGDSAGNTQRFGIQIDSYMYKGSLVAADEFCVTGNNLLHNKIGGVLNGTGTTGPTRLITNNLGSYRIDVPAN